MLAVKQASRSGVVMSVGLIAVLVVCPVAFADDAEGARR